MKLDEEKKSERREKKKATVRFCFSMIDGRGEGPYRTLRGRVNSVGFQPDERLIPYLELVGFGSAALIRTFDLRYDLIFALVERWRPETHTFHLTCGECTVTLEDVVIQLGLPIDGNTVTGAVRAYIMHLIRGVLMPDANGSKVHLMYLPLLSNLHNTRSYSWGSAVLAMLYRELCRTIDPSAVDIGRCLILLQSWALYRMPFLASISHQSYVFPLVNRWSTNPGIGRSSTVPIYRLMIENHAREGFIWMPYYASEIMAVMPSSAHVHSNLWCISAPIINFNVVEWYHGNRVLRQFGCIQYIPTLPVQLGEIHGMSKRGRYGDNWG
ncbi:serine/threonine-protein phosphatase 7 long form homolog [Gossypium raimondii]|uniref:serine/threonine-protein phosphatase 7 long form homolog n=1 Tax=Gossypium raimondii TaxID=29730 RepID=UPI00227D5E37|nr:serine/threonine-protein phosphatase 7 long form homolog [Gossypium raimondii]